MAIGLCAAGCDTFTFSPPRPPELTTPARSPRAAAVPSTPAIEVVLTPRSESDVAILKGAVRIQAGIDKLRVQVAAPAEDAPAAAQAEYVRKAVAGKPAVVLIETPVEPVAELIQAAADARKAGVAVVSLGLPLGEPKGAESAGGSPARMVLVTNEAFDESARTLVADAIRSAKNGGIATDSAAVILVDPTVDSLVQDRVAALRKALEAAGVKRIDQVEFKRTVEDGKGKLVAFMEAHPDATMVFGVDSIGVLSADEATGVLRDKHRYAIAGYTGDDSARNQILMSEYAAIGVMSIERLLRRGVNVAGGLANGDPVPDKDVLMVPVSEATPTAGLPRMRYDPPEGPSPEKSVQPSSKK